MRALILLILICQLNTLFSSDIDTECNAYIEAKIASNNYLITEFKKDKNNPENSKNYNIAIDSDNDTLLIENKFLEKLLKIDSSKNSIKSLYVMMMLETYISEHEHELKKDDVKKEKKEKLLNQVKDLKESLKVISKS